MKVLLVLGWVVLSSIQPDKLGAEYLDVIVSEKYGPTTEYKCNIIFESESVYKLYTIDKSEVVIQKSNCSKLEYRKDTL